MNGKELLQKAHRTIENVYKVGYADGCSDKQHDLEHAYAKGLEDAWECARSVINNEVPFEFWNLASEPTRIKKGSERYQDEVYPYWNGYRNGRGDLTEEQFALLYLDIELYE